MLKAWFEPEEKPPPGRVLKLVLPPVRGELLQLWDERELGAVEDGDQVVAWGSVGAVGLTDRGAL